MRLCADIFGNGEKSELMGRKVPKRMLAKHHEEKDE